MTDKDITNEVVDQNMTDREILKKAIQKAIDGGWVNEERFSPIEVEGYVFLHRPETPHFVEVPRVLIYNHDFAKALWGSFNDNLEDGMPKLTFQDPRELADKWQYHLQQMVIAPNPIEYLGDNL